MKKIEDARIIYERLVEQFPNAGKYWKIYIEQEVNRICVLHFHIKLLYKMILLLLFWWVRHKYRFLLFLKRIRFLKPYLFIFYIK